MLEFRDVGLWNITSRQGKRHGTLNIQGMTKLDAKSGFLVHEANDHGISWKGKNEDTMSIRV